MRLVTVVNAVRVEIDLPGVSETAYAETAAILDRALREGKVKNRDAIQSTFLYALRNCPTANASDLWHHVVYRLYCESLRRYRGQDPKQSWVRAGGEALELIVEEWYTPVLAPHGVRIQALIGNDLKKTALKDMGIQRAVGAAKLDMALYRRKSEADAWRIFGGVHVKASLAERVSDDVPASRAMMRKGFLSPLWTLDVKSFPPPHGDLVNRGELGTPATPSEKRRYVEEHGDFDNLYSANTRSVPSGKRTTSGKRIYQLTLHQQPDQFALHILARAKA